MSNIVTLPTGPQRPTPQQRRLRAVVKRLVIELGALEQYLSEGLQDAHIKKAAKGLDGAIDCLNAYLGR